MVYVQFGTDNDRFLRKISSANEKNSLEYTEIINTPQLKKFDCRTYSCNDSLELTHEFLAIVMLEISGNSNEANDFSVTYHDSTYEFTLSSQY